MLEKLNMGNDVNRILSGGK